VLGFQDGVAQEPGVAQDVVVEYSPRQGSFTDTHERVTRTEIARRLAALLGFAYAGAYDPSAPYPGRVYFVPSDTLVGLETAAQLGIRTEHHLFGGVVPYPFVATKLITHPRIDMQGPVPEGWSNAFPDQVRDCVLRGFSVFTPEQALAAGQRLLEHGPVRLKPVHASAGRGQIVLMDTISLKEVTATLDSHELAEVGLVLEENLTGVITYSVGQVHVGDLTAAYYGSQRLTTDLAGSEVYGGSDLVVVRGDFGALYRLSLAEGVRIAVEQARNYDAATSVFPGMFASRRNYDVAQGLDARGEWRSGVLEQSWRMGGATGAEIAALEAFRADPRLHVVRASTIEIYGECSPPPLHATVYFRGADERLGLLTKYTVVGAHDDTR
jgi:hypothetical protein